MTVFCTACGKPNTDEAEKCVSCGHQLKAAEPGSKKRFKGTMMMGAGGLGTPEPSPGPQQNPTAETPPPRQAAPVETPPETQPDHLGPMQSGAAGGKKNLAFQKTMMGPVGGMGELIKQQGSPEPPGDAATDVDHGQAPARSVSQPAGGFGPPAQSSSGFAQPAQSADPSPSQSGFGPPVQTGPLNAGDVPSGPPSGSFGSGGGEKSNKTKYILLGGLGCLVIVLLTCLIGGYIAYTSMMEAVEEAQLQAEQGAGLGAGVQGELARLDLNASLSSLQVICDMDRSAEGARETFHPDVFADLRTEACKVDRSAIRAFADATRSNVAATDPTLPETSQCYVFSSGGASITTCDFQGDTVITAMQGIDQIP